MSKFLDEFNYFDPAEKRGIIILLTVLLLVIALLIWSPFSRQETIDDETLEQQKAEYLQFMASVHEREAEQSQSRYPQRGTGSSYQPRYYQPRYNREPQRRNTSGADSTRSREPSLYQADTTYQRPFKYDEITVMNLNTADTTELKKIPGIGSGIAGMIVGYRKQLGGFYDISQLGEINLDYQQLEPWFIIDESDIQRINVNKSSVDYLRRHPYINFYQAKALVEYRRLYGDIKNLRVFTLYDEFSDTDFERLGHYICFE